MRSFISDPQSVSLTTKIVQCAVAFIILEGKYTSICMPKSDKGKMQCSTQVCLLIKKNKHIWTLRGMNKVVTLINFHSPKSSIIFKIVTLPHMQDIT